MSYASTNNWNVCLLNFTGRKRMRKISYSNCPITGNKCYFAVKIFCYRTRMCAHFCAHFHGKSSMPFL